MPPKVSVAVPTYNGSEFIKESLECLRGQTLRDIEVVMLDNASTDGTGDICARFAALDSRFRYVRNPTTIPMVDNFRKAMGLTSGPYFMWRADDDLSAPDFIERLAECLDDNASANLAVCPIERVLPNGDRKRLDLPATGSPADLLSGCHAAWFYGLWRRGAALDDLWRMIDAYPYTWASDHIGMLPTIVRGEVTLCRETLFQQRILREASYSLPPSELLKARKAYARLAMPLVNGHVSRKDMHEHLERRVASRGRTYRRFVEVRLRHLLGMKPKHTGHA